MGPADNGICDPAVPPHVHVEFCQGPFQQLAGFPDKLDALLIFVSSGSFATYQDFSFPFPGYRHLGAVAVQIKLARPASGNEGGGGLDMGKVGLGKESLHWTLIAIDRKRMNARIPTQPKIRNNRPKTG